jgi:MFS family permease
MDEGLCRASAWLSPQQSDNENALCVLGGYALAYARVDTRARSAAIAAVATESMWVAVPAVVVFGFCISNAGIAIQTLIQLASDRGMRGRLMGLYGLIFRAPALGARAAAIASAHFGLRWPVFFGALFVIAVCLWTYGSRKRIAAALTAEAQSHEAC